MSLASGNSTVLVLVLITIFLVLFLVSWIPLKRGRQLLLRPLRSLNLIKEQAEKGTENGTETLFSPGVGALNGQAGTAEALNALNALASVSRYHARTRSTLAVATNDALIYLAAASTGRQAYAGSGREADFDPQHTRLITQQDNLAYMAGLNYAFSNEQVSGSVMLGRFGSEYLLTGEKLARRNLSQVVGSTQVEGLPLMIATAGMENVLLGEEVYAAPAYLARRPTHLASLAAQDFLRAALIIAMIAGVTAATLGFSIQNYFLP